MIVKMSKLQVVVSNADREKLLDKLHDLGVLHIMPVDPATAIAEEKLSLALNEVHKAIPLLEAVEYDGRPVEGDPVYIAEEVLENHHQHEEHLNKIAACHKLIDEQAIWGDVKLEDIEALADAGMNVEFYKVPAE